MYSSIYTAELKSFHCVFLPLWEEVPFTLGHYRLGKSNDGSCLNEGTLNAF